MSKFQILWNYTRKKNGEIIIAEEELQKMLLTGGYQVTCADHEGQTVAGDTAPLTAEAKNQMVQEFDQNVNGKTE